MYTASAAGLNILVSLNWGNLKNVLFFAYTQLNSLLKILFNIKKNLWNLNDPGIRLHKIKLFIIKVLSSLPDNIIITCYTYTAI